MSTRRQLGSITALPARAALVVVLAWLGCGSEPQAPAAQKPARETAAATPAVERQTQALEDDPDEGGGSPSSAIAPTGPDSVAPALSVDGASERSTSDDTITLAGTVTDPGSGLSSIVVRNSRYASQSFAAIVDEHDRFSAELPLALGANVVTVRADDRAGNHSERQLTVTLVPGQLPTVAILAPLQGAHLSGETVAVSGRVRSSLPPEQVRITIGAQVTFPTGSGGEYTYSFANVPIVRGANTLVVRAATVYGSSSAQVIVQRDSGEGGTSGTPPTVRVQGAAADVYVAGATVRVAGTATATRCISSVKANNVPALLTGSGTSVSFDVSLAFAGGSDTLNVDVDAEDCDGLHTHVTYVAHRDSQAPVISVEGLSTSGVNNSEVTPLPVHGSIAELHLAGFSIDGRSVGVLPAQSGSYGFSADVPLVHGPARPLVLEAWDFAGNRSSVSLSVALSGQLVVELLAPQDGARFMASGSSGTLEVVARVPGMAPGDKVRARVDSGAFVDIPAASSVARGSVSAGGGDHTLLVRVENSAGATLGAQSVRFSVVDQSTIPLAVATSDPAPASQGREGNSLIVVQFTKPIADPLLLNVRVLETVHGLTYGGGAGSASNGSTAPALVRVDRNREPVPGRLVVLPGDASARFEPSRELAFGAKVDVEVFYDDTAIGKLAYGVRGMPTLVAGSVFDTTGVPVAGVDVSLLELDRTTRTDDDGSYSFGFGEIAERDLPGGRYTLRINGGGKLLEHGSSDRRIVLEAGRFHSIGVTRLPTIDDATPRRMIEAGATTVLFDDGRLTLDLTQAQVRMPDGSAQGGVSIQPVRRSDVSFQATPLSAPSWLYVAHPVGVELDGSIGISVAMPTIDGTHDYLEALADQVLVVARDPASLELVPVGIANIDREQKRVRSTGGLPVHRLDALGYTALPRAAQPLLDRHTSGELTFAQLMRELTTARP